MPESVTLPHCALLGLGSNMSGPLGAPSDYLAAAIEEIKSSESMQFVRRSGLYRSAPWGKGDQDDFINTVVEVRCRTSAAELLDNLLAIESQLGRVRGEKWGPRLIDIDLLTFDDEVSDSGTLILPHPRMHLRAFVLRPLLELEPDFEIPGMGSARACLERLADTRHVEPFETR